MDFKKEGEGLGFGEPFFACILNDAHECTTNSYLLFNKIRVVTHTLEFPTPICIDLVCFDTINQCD